MRLVPISALGAGAAEYCAEECWTKAYKYSTTPSATRPVLEAVDAATSHQRMWIKGVGGSETPEFKIGGILTVHWLDVPCQHGLETADGIGYVSVDWTVHASASVII
ncbi:hypothetical protein J6590_086660 [Homalodisca vitripennis]|nr:hypothetical protein J6590_086660 [Homalodisca vitripennis]